MDHFKYNNSFPIQGSFSAEGSPLNSSRQFQNSNRNLTNSSNKNLRSKEKIEDSLLKRYYKSKSKQKLLKQKFLAEELKEVQNTPTINKISKILASNPKRNCGKKSDYISFVLSNSKFVKMVKNKQEKEIKTAKIVLKDPDSPKMALPLEKNLYWGRNFMKNKVNHSDFTIENNSNLLEMNVLNRNKFWINQKQQNLIKIQDEMTQNGMKDCTFSPLLSPRTNMNHISTQIKSANLSYSELYQEKIKYRNQNINKNITKTNYSKTSRETKKVKNKLIHYNRLSPFKQKISFTSGSNLKKLKISARPMAKYFSSSVLK